jgi:toxin CcdB
MQFTVFRNADTVGRRRVPYLLSVQSDLIGDMRTCVVVPLISPQHAEIATTGLMPILHVEGKPWVMDTPLLAGISRKALGPPVADLSQERSVILAALDLLISGI